MEQQQIKAKEPQSRPDRNPDQMKKTIQQAQTMAFTTQLFYYTMKVFVCFILYKQKNILWGSPIETGIFIVLLICNTYLMTKSGEDPGFETNCTPSIQNEQELLSLQNNQNYCDICKCRKKMRTKHCFRCGRCVRKYDHHCPWIGTCVGQKNHCMFVGMLIFQVVQSSYTFWICLASMKMYQYKQNDGTFGPEFGVFAFFAMFMGLYIVFVLCLLGFHSFLIITNTTTNQMVKKGSLPYMKGIKGNPFSEGLISNIKLALWVPTQGHQWIIKEKGDGQSKSKISLIWSNQYYDCC